MIVWFPQEFTSSCVAACVRMVLNHLNDQREEAAARQLIGYTRFGVSLVTAQAKLANSGAIAEWHDDWNVTDLRDALRAGQYPIVGVEHHLLGYPRAFHAVVVHVTSTMVEALDPLDGPAPQRYGYATFTDAWELAGREVLLIEAPPVL